MTNHENSLHKTIISGIVTVTWECCGGHAIEYAKIVKQTKTLTYLDIFKQMTNNGTRVHGILDGFLPYGAIQAAFKGAVFGWAHAMIRNSMYKNTSIDKFYIETIAGGLAGGVQGLILSPVLLLKTRVMTDPNFRTSKASTSFIASSIESSKLVGTVISREGISGLMKGSAWFSGKRVADWTTRFFFVEVIENMLKKISGREKLSFTESLGSSLLGGSLSAFATIPLDVIVANLQSSDKANSKVSGASILSGGDDFWKKSTRGFVARAAHVAITTAMMKTVVGSLTKSYENYTKGL